NRGGYHPADHGRGDAFHYVGASAVTPENGQQAGDDDGGSHGFGADAPDRAVIDGVAQISRVAHPALPLPLRVGQVQVKQHDHAGFGIQPRESDQADPDGNAEVVIKQIENPDGADQGKGDSREHDDSFDPGAGVEVNDQKDDEKRERDNNHQAVLRTKHVFILAA